MKTNLTIDGRKFRINGQLTYSEIPNCNASYHGMLMNSRMIQGIFDDKQDVSRFNRYGKTFTADKNTNELIEALPEWYSYGLRGITVGFQGGGSCFTIDNRTITNNAFSEDGMAMDPDYLDRMKRIILACDELGMVVIVSYFYGLQTRFLKDDMAVMEAVKTASNWIRDNKFTNVIIEIANEHNINEFRIHPILFDPKGIEALIEIAKRESGGVPVGCSGGGGYCNEGISKASDVVLIHGNGLTRERLAQLITKVKNQAPNTPIVCNEDSQAISQLQVCFNEEVSWGYYNNMTKQEPPAYWGVTAGEDEFFAKRMAKFLGILVTEPKLEDQFYLQGFEKHMTYNNNRWIRLASLYPEKISYVEFYRNDELFYTTYEDPFTIYNIWNWMQRPIADIKQDEKWCAKVYLVTGEIITKYPEE